MAKVKYGAVISPVVDSRDAMQGAAEKIVESLKVTTKGLLREQRRGVMHLRRAIMVEDLPTTMTFRGIGGRYDIVDEMGEVVRVLGKIPYPTAEKKAREFTEELLRQGEVAISTTRAISTVKVAGSDMPRVRKEELSEEEKARLDAAVERMKKEWEQREARFREKLARRWRPWAAHIRFIRPAEEIPHPLLIQTGEVVACTGCGLTAAASSARRSIHEVRDCPRCGGQGDGEWRGGRAHLTRAQKRWECDDCQAGIASETLYVVLGEWPGSMRRLCVGCAVVDWKRDEGSVGNAGFT